MTVNNTSKSSTIRDMYHEGCTVAQIAKELNCNYSFVYGVVKKESDKTGTPMIKSAKGGKSTLIRSMWDTGKTIGEISKELNSNYSYVWTVVEKYRQAEPAAATEPLIDLTK